MTFDPTSAVPEPEFDPASATPDTGPAPGTVVRSVIGIKPDDYAEAEKLAKRYLLPAPTAYRKLPELRQQAQSDDVQETLRTTKALQAYLAANPGVAAQAHDDVGALASLENFARDLGGAVKAGVYRSSKGAAGTFRAGLELVAPVLDVTEPTEPTDPELTRNPLLPYIPLPGGNPLRRLAEGFAMQAAGADATADAARPKKDGALVGGFFSGIESLTQNLLSLPMAFAPGGQGAALAAMTSQTGGDAYQDARDKGLPMSQALPFAASQAAIEYATEKLPLGALLKDVKAGTGFLLTAGKQIALEVPGEQIATVLQDLNEWAVLNPDKPFTSYLEERPSAAAQTLVATVVGAGGNVAVAKGIETVIERAVRDGVNMQRAGVTQQAMEQALKGAEASALRERNPEAFRALMQSMTEDGSVYVDAEVLNQLPADVLKQLEGVTAELELALPINAPVAVKLADVLTFAPGTPAAELFMQNARSAPDAPTALEAEQAGEKAQEWLKQEADRVIAEAQDQEAMRASSEVVRTTIQTELAATGRYSPAVSETMSQWAGAFYTTMASRNGMTPEQMFQKYRLRVLGEATSAGQVVEQGALSGTLAERDAAAANMTVEEFDAATREQAVAAAPGQPEAWYRGQAAFNHKNAIKRHQKRIADGSAPSLKQQAPRVPQTDTPEFKRWFGDSKVVEQQGLVALANGYQSVQIGDSTVEVSVKDDHAEVSMVRTPEDKRGQGSARAALEQVLRAADTQGLTVTLTPEPMDRKTSKAKLEKFYRSLGFVPNKGRNKDYRYSSAMIRQPASDNSLQQAARVPQTDTPEFKAWFGDSKVVDAEGKPLVVYHGTGADFSVFDREAATANGKMFGAGIYLTARADYASAYAADTSGIPPRPLEGGNVMPVYAHITNPYIFDGRAPSETKPADIAKAARDGGYDGIIVHGGLGEMQEIIAFNPEQIKSAIGNDGSFDANDPSILSQGPRGTFSPKSLELVLNPNANLSTWFHETGHFFLEVMSDLASQPDAPPQIVEDTAKIMAWFGVPDVATWRAMTLDQQRPYHERWAESIEQYVMEGKAPSAELAPLMRRFAAWLKSVYGSIKAFLASRGVAPAGGETLGQLPAPSVLNEPRNPTADEMRTHGRVESVSLDKAVSFQQRRDWAKFDRRESPGELVPGFGDKPLAVKLETGEYVVLDGNHRTDRAMQAGADTLEMYVIDAKAYDPQNAGRRPAPRDDAADDDLLAALGQGIDPNAPLNIQLNDDIRRVMDRMLATDEQIAQANAVAGLMPDEAADGEAADRLRKRSMRDLQWTVRARDKAIKALQKQAAAIRKATEAEVRAEVEQMPEVRAKAALDALRKDKNLNDLTTATVADSFGYESVDAMLKAIDAFGSKKDAIDGMTEQRMLEEHGDLINEDAITQAANEAVHNAARARALATELKTQAEMLGAREATGEVNAKGRKITASVIAKAAEQFAARVVGRTPLRDLKNRAWQHTAAERRAGKRWQEATSAGKTEEAVKAKQDQVLNHAAARAALEAQAEVKRIVTFFRDRVAKGNDEKVVERGRDPDIVNAARAVLAAYGVQTPASKGADAYLDALETNDPETYAVVKPMVDEATRSAQPIESLTYDELLVLRDHVDAMWHLAKRSRQMEVDGNLLDIEDAADELHARMVEIGIPDRIPGEGRAVTKAEQRSTFLKQGLAFVRRVEQWAEGMDGKYGGPFLRLVFQPVKDAADRYRADRIKYRKKLQTLVDNLAPVVGDATIDAPELGYTFGTPGSTAGTAMNEVLHAILHTGNDSNKRKLLLGRQWAAENADGTLDTSRWDAFLQRLANEGKLQPAHMEFVQGVWDLLEETKPLAQKTHRDVFGRYFAEVTADAFVDPFGVQRRGGYVPAQVDTRLVKDNELRKLAEAENESMAFAFPQPNRGFTKSRTEYNRPLMLDLRTLGQHLDKVLLFSHMTPAATGARRLLTNKGVGQALGRIQPEAMGSMLQPWLQRSAQQIVETPVVGAGNWARIPGIVRSRAGMALMFANVSNTIQQITGLSTAAVKVKPSHMMRAAAQYVAHPVKFAREVWALSSYMDDRAKNEVAMMNEQMQDILIRPGVYERTQSWSMRHAYFLQTAFDNVLSPIIWTGAYNQALAEGMSDRDAIRSADGTVRQTQGSTLPEDVSRIETGPAYARVFTQFVGYFNMMANTNATALKQIAGEMGLKRGAGKALYVVAMGLMVPLWVAEAIAVAFRGGPDDEDNDGYLDDWLAAVFGFGTFKGMLAQVPVLGQFAVAGMNRFNDNPMDDRVSLSPAVSLLESAVGAPKSVYDAIVEDGSAQKAIRDVATLVSVATGVPVYAAARPLGYAAGVAQGRTEPTSGADAVRGLVTGTASAESRQ